MEILSSNEILTNLSKFDFGYSVHKQICVSGFQFSQSFVAFVLWCGAHDSTTIGLLVLSWNKFFPEESIFFLKCHVIHVMRGINRRALDGDLWKPNCENLGNIKFLLNSNLKKSNLKMIYS